MKGACWEPLSSGCSAVGLQKARWGGMASSSEVGVMALVIG